jgi:hypothetical protein
MTIDPKTGEITIGEPPMIIGPRLTKTNFLCSPAGGSARLSVSNLSYSTYLFTLVEGIDKFAIRLVFDGQCLSNANLVKADSTTAKWNNWSEERELRRKQEHDHLLVASLGSSPYSFPWGEVVSDCDPRSGASNISIRYKQ